MRKMFGSLALVAALLISGQVMASPATAESAAATTVGVRPAVPGTKVVAKPSVGKDARTAAAVSCSTPTMLYSGTRQILTGTDYTSGISANLHVYPTYLHPNDCHTLTEISAQSTYSGNLRNIVEVGSTVDPGVCGAQPVPCLFVFWWKNGVAQCYNGCGFVPSSSCTTPSATYCAGESLLALAGAVPGNGIPYRFQLQYQLGAWWVAFNNVWIGSFPQSLWNSATPSGPAVVFDKAQAVQGFVELAAAGPTTTPCSDMGNGIVSTGSTNAARVGTVALHAPVSPSTLTPNMTAGGTYAPYPAPNVLSTMTARVGGPGTGGVKDGC